MSSADTIGRVLMEAVSISHKRPKDPAIRAWARVEYKNDSAYAEYELSKRRLPRAV